MKYQACLLIVKNMEKSRYLFETLLGQKVTEDYGENIGFEGGFSLHEKKHFEQLIQGRPVGKGSNDFELYFENDDLEPISQLVKDQGLSFVHDIMEQPWRQRVMRFYDYDFHIIEVGESLEHTAWRLSQEGMELDKIAETTYMPIEAVKASIEKYSKS